LKNNLSDLKRFKRFGGIIVSLSLLVVVGVLQGCISYSLSGASTNAKTMQVDQFFNNTDLGPANLGQNFTNKLKDYFQQNSSLRIVSENGELQIEGTLTQYAVSPIAIVANTSAATTSAGATSSAAQTRLTIAVKINYVDSLEPKNSFKDKTFSFYADFDNSDPSGFLNNQESLEKKIFHQIFIDIFNATIANW
jgi:hypothetical protein